ncbi:MAG: hypothetical protein ACFFGZ_14040 [Candidatus Thorarchaeota archaeon]
MFYSLESTIAMLQSLGVSLIEVGDEVNSILWLIAAGLSLIPLTIFLISYRRIKSEKFLVITTAFGFFFLKAVILSTKLFVQGYDDELWWSVAAILDIITMGLIAYSLSANDVS